MSKKIFLGVFFLLLVVIGVYFIYYIKPICDDELYNYGFGVSILDGRVPYRDFNMIVPPLFPYLVSLILMLFGKKLIVYHVFLMVMLVGITYLCYRKIGFFSLFIYVLGLLYPYIGYNLFCLFLLFLLICYSDSSSIRDSVIICFMILCKQTMGLLILPCFLFSKCKKKVFLIYFVAFLCLILYLLICGNLFSFFDYCFLGMFQFVSHNGRMSLFLYIELLSIVFLFFVGIKTLDKKYFYVLCFQIIAFPCINYTHFLTAFLPVLYLLFSYFIRKKFIFGNVFLGCFSFMYFVFFVISFMRDYSYRYYMEGYHQDGFMKGRVVSSATEGYIEDISSSLSKYSDYEPYILGSFSYLVKLNLNFPLNRFDIINRGNMGYGGSDGYIEEIDKNCMNKRCIFILNDGEALGKLSNQVDTDILQHIRENYYQVRSSSIFSIYISSD